MNKLNHKKMVVEIDKLLQGDWAVTLLDCKKLPNAEPFTQKEAHLMSDVLGKIYMIAHCIHCTACQSRYYKK